MLVPTPGIGRAEGRDARPTPGNGHAGGRDARSYPWEWSCRGSGCSFLPLGMVMPRVGMLVPTPGNGHAEGRDARSSPGNGHAEGREVASRVSGGSSAVGLPSAADSAQRAGTRPGLRRGERLPRARAPGCAPGTTARTHLREGQRRTQRRPRSCVREFPMIRSYATSLAFKQALEQRIKPSSTTGVDFARRSRVPGTYFGPPPGGNWN
jgi:hypothetical protein